MLTDGETGKFTTYLGWDEVEVEWMWCDGEDWGADGFFDIFVTKSGIDITYDITKQQTKFIEDEVKEIAGYEPPSRQRVSRAINGHFNKTF